MLIVLVHELAYFFKHDTKGVKGDAENEVIGMVEFFIDDNVV